MTKAHIVNRQGRRVGREELEHRIATALAEAQDVLAPGILSDLIADLVKRNARVSPRP